MIAISCWVPGVPKAQPRPRAVRAGNGVRVYDPGSAQEWKLAIMAALAAQTIGRPSYECPVEVVLQFRMPRPKGCTEEWHRKKPDIDNLQKPVLDALTAMSVWRDDSQVVHMTAWKRYEGEAGPGVTIWVDEAK